MPLQKFEWPLNAKALSNHIFKATNLTYVFAISIVFIDRKVLCLFFFVQHPQMTIRSFFYWVNWMRRCLRRISNSNEITKQYEPFEIVCRSWNIYIYKKNRNANLIYTGLLLLIQSETTQRIVKFSSTRAYLSVMAL